MSVAKAQSKIVTVFVSELPHETEEQCDEEDSNDDLDDVEKFLKEDDESDLVLEV